MKIITQSALTRNIGATLVVINTLISHKIKTTDRWNKYHWLCMVWQTFWKTSGLSLTRVLSWISAKPIVYRLFSILNSDFIHKNVCFYNVWIYPRSHSATRIIRAACYRKFYFDWESTHGNGIHADLLPVCRWRVFWAESPPSQLFIVYFLS